MDTLIVVFRTAGGDITVSASKDSSLLEIAQRAGVAIDAPCGGGGTCGKCKVRLQGGTLNYDAANGLTSEEVAAGWRLACRSTLIEDVMVELPDSSLAWQRGLKVNDKVREDDPVWLTLIRLLKDTGLWSSSGGEVLTLELKPPTIDDNTPDADRLKNALAVATGREDVQLSLTLLRTLPEFLREQNYKVRCLLSYDGQGEKQGQDPDKQGQSPQYEQEQPPRLVALQSQTSSQTPCALACDIGTTSVSVQLIDLVEGKALAQASAGNAQIRYGADVINRIMQQAKPGGMDRLQQAIVEQTINPLITAVCEKAHVLEECISHAVLVGNTTMNHLLLGVQANPLRMEPYVPCFGKVEGLKAGELSLVLPPSSPVYLAPNVGSYVGGDITAGVLASGLWQSEELQLFVDLGTNGELVFGNNEFMMCCACSAGPAFEGGGIRCGMRATDGAVERASIDRETFEPTLGVIGGGRPSGICGSGLIDLISELFLCGALDSRGRFVASGERFTRDTHDMRRYVVAFAEETEDGRTVFLDEVDLENFIRAKGAIFSAISVMLNATGCTPSDISRVLVAGGIGSGISIDNAVTIGLFPDIARESYVYLGNTSLLGARAMAQSASVREKVAEIASGMTYLELSSDPGYMDAFVAACFLPHTDTSLFPSV